MAHLGCRAWRFGFIWGVWLRILGFGSGVYRYDVVREERRACDAGYLRPGHEKVQQKTVDCLRSQEARHSSASLCLSLSRSLSALVREGVVRHLRWGSGEGYWSHCPSPGGQAEPLSTNPHVMAGSGFQIHDSP